MDKAAGTANMFSLEDGRLIIFPDVIEYEAGDRNNGYGCNRSKRTVYELIYDRSKIKIKDFKDGGRVVEYGNGISSGLSPENGKLYTLTDNRLLIIRDIEKTKMIILDKSQKEAAARIETCFSENKNPVCAYPVGTGKTFIACETIRRFREKNRKNILLLARAGNLEDPWEKTLKQFGIPFLSIHGPKRKDDYLFSGKYPAGGPVILTSYDTRLADNGYYDAGIEYDLVVFDELHTIINPRKITKKSAGFSKIKAKHRLAVTATPVQNTEADMRFISVFLNDSGRFFALLKEGDNAVKNTMFSAAGNEAKKHTAVILPERAEERAVDVKKIILSVPLSAKMSAFINENQEISNNEHRLLSFLSCPESVYYHYSAEKPDIPCAKADAVGMIVNRVPKDDKIIIFSRYIDVLDSYCGRLKDMGHNSLIITGKDRSETKGKLSQFRNNPAFRILLTTLFKSAEGLNLEAANHVIILEPWWNPQKIFQAMGRIDRRTQKKDSFVYLLFYNENGSIYTVETKYLKAMKKKIEYARSVIPDQQELPEIKAFVSEDTFIKDFGEFLAGFTKVNREKIKQDTAREMPAVEQRKENRNTKEINQQELPEILRQEIEEKYRREIMKYFFPEPNFDDVVFRS